MPWLAALLGSSGGAAGAAGAAEAAGAGAGAAGAAGAGSALGSLGGAASAAAPAAASSGWLSSLGSSLGDALVGSSPQYVSEAAGSVGPPTAGGMGLIGSGGSVGTGGLLPQIAQGYGATQQQGGLSINDVMRLMQGNGMGGDPSMGSYAQSSQQSGVGQSIGGILNGVDSMLGQLEGRGPAAPAPPQLTLPQPNVPQARPDDRLSFLRAFNSTF